MKNLRIIVATTIIGLFSCSNPTLQDDLKTIKEDIRKIRNDHEVLKNHLQKLTKDAIQEELKSEDKLEGSQMD